MDLSNKKTRDDLEEYFKQNNIPTTANFKNFIRSTLNQIDDGIIKPPGDPICIKASMQIYKPVLNFYEEFTDANPSWTISLASMSDSRGFTIGNLQENKTGINARIFIELATGNIGIGTVMPAEKLDVGGGFRAQSAQITGATTLGSTLEVTGALMAKSTVDVVGAVHVNAGVLVDGAMNARSASITERMTAGNATVTNTLSAAAVSVTNALSAGSATIAGAANAASANVSGALSAGSATVTNMLTAGNVTINGAVTAQSATVNGALQVVSITAQSTNAVADLPLAGKGTGGTVRAKTAFVAESTLDVTGKVTAAAAVEVTGAVIAKSTLDVTGKLNANAAVDVSGALSANATVDVAGKLTAANGIDVRNETRTNPNDHPAGRPFYVTGAVTDTQGIEFRTSDATEGIGFGPTTIYAAGTKPTQDLVLAPKGTAEKPGFVRVQSGLQVDSITPQSSNTIANLTLAGKGSMGAVRVMSPITATSTLDVTDKLTANAALDVKSTLDVTGKLTANAALDAKSTLDVMGAVIAKSTVDVTGKLNANAALDVTGAVLAKSTVEITGRLTAAGGLDLRSTARTNDHPAGRPFYVTGVTDTQGIEFRTSDATEGIGFGPTTMYAAGTKPTQDLVLAAKGTAEKPGFVRVQSGLQVDSITPQSNTVMANLTLEGKGPMGAVRVTSPLKATSTLEVTDKLTANAALEAKSTLDVTGKLTANAALDAKSTLDVTAALTAKSTLDVTGAVTAKSTVEITGKLTASGGLDLQNGGRTNLNDHPTGRALYVTGVTETQGIEFRTSNATEGIGFGPTTMYAAGTKTNQDLVLKPKGTGAVVLANVKIGTSTTTATSIVETIQSSTAETAIPTTSAVRSYVASQIPVGATDLATAPNNNLATVSAVKTFVNQAIPVGSILMWSGDTAPTGWALCDGNNGTPDLRNRFVLGRGGSRAVGDKGGAETVTLTMDQIPAHSHTATTGNAGTHAHYHAVGQDTTGNISYYGNGNEHFLRPADYQGSTVTGGDHTHSLTINNTGGGAPHDNMPPYYILAYIMRVS